MRPGDGWGKTYHSKNKVLYGNNGFSILDTELEFEHLTFTKNVANIVEKLKSDAGYFVKQGIGLREILNGNLKNAVTYEELGQVQRDYADREKELRAMIDG